MLTSTIVLPVDVLGNDVLVNQTYVLDVRNDEKRVSIYTGPSHTFLAEDTIQIQTFLPQRAGNFNGVVKSSAKIRETQVIPGFDSTTTVSTPAILKIETSLPVGISTASITEIRNRAIALLDHALYQGIMENAQY